MSGRPEILFPLFASLTTLPGIGEKTAKTLAASGRRTPKDLIWHLPSGVIDRRPRDSVDGLAPGDVATIEVLVERHHPSRGKGRPWRVDVRDGSIAFVLVFFHARADRLIRELPPGERRIVSGRVDIFDGRYEMIHPDHILPPDKADTLPEFEAVYPLTEGVTARVMARATAAAVDLAPDLPEWIDPDLLRREGWPSWREAMQAAHQPRGHEDLSPLSPARRRLAYDELFCHQLTLALARARRRKRKGRRSSGSGRLRKRVLSALPYRPTAAQERTMREIADDMAEEARMNRLLQGDVGAGKTLVAFMSLLIAVEAGGQGALMAPTELLARQHHAALRPLADAAGIRFAILTGRDRGSERTRVLKALGEGGIDILVGTHSIFQEDVAFRDLRLAVIDEQHRFGVAERLELGRKGEAADILVMTATPIPRSLSLAHFGDMDISILDEKPPGRTPVRTALVAAPRLDEVIAHLVRATAEGRQAYWVCPLVVESGASEKTAVEARHRSLAEVLGPDAVGLVHGQLAPAERDAAMSRFAAGETKVLVATTVIEVGVDVPNASIMIVEGADTFGLAQLHQLRGRVGRGAAASSCLLLYDPPLGETARRRLEILRETEDGFRIAEEDLAIRGAGDLIGTAQSGLPRFRVADVERQAALMDMARDDARVLIEADAKLEGGRGRAARTLLWLLEADRAIAMISVG